jgi:hypothetical protein
MDMPLTFGVHRLKAALLVSACTLAFFTSCGGDKAPASNSEPVEEEAPQTEEERMGDYDASEEELSGANRIAAEEGDDIFEAFVLPGHTILGSARGDLNKDAYPDGVLVLAVEGEENADPAADPAPRPLLLLLGREDGSYQMAGRNDKVVLCHSCGGVFGDPYEGITIKDGYFSIEHYGGSNWRWTRIITFKWSEKDKTWLLHKDGGVSYHTSDPDKMKEEVKTVKDFGVISFEKFDYEDGQ